MALANGDTVAYRFPFPPPINPYPPIRGVMAGLTAGTADIAWANGLSQADVAVTALAKFIATSVAGADVANTLIGRAVKVILPNTAGVPAQEFTGIVVDTYTLEGDAGAGAQNGHIIVCLSGRGGDGMAQYMDIQVAADFSDALAQFQVLGPNQQFRY